MIFLNAWLGGALLVFSLHKWGAGKPWVFDAVIGATNTAIVIFHVCTRG